MGDINKDFAEGDETLMKIDSDYDNQTSNIFCQLFYLSNEY